ncbi:hypothetical protein C8R44DRAFT_728346 [Mycena epipterygia]|nr:hypothetical protein C8R44DRAFT_728346 [Mycena epipterygia]
MGSQRTKKVVVTAWATARQLPPRQLTCNCPGFCLLCSHLFPLLTDLRERLPFLRRLTIWWSNLESQAGVESIDCFERAPSLVDATIFNNSRHVPTLIPAHQLTRYDIDGPWEMHRAILTLASNLVQARIQIRFDDESWPESGEIIHVLRLQRLFSSHGDVLTYLSAPVLQEIAFDVPEEGDPNYLFYLDPFVLRSGCILRRLSFSGSPTTDTAAEMLRKYPSIMELAIVHTSHQSFNECMSHLTIKNPSGSTAMSPQLLEIYLGFYSDDSGIDYTLFLHMLQSRWKAKECALNSAALLTDSGTGPDPATLHALDVLRRDGMDILVQQGTKASNAMDSWTYNPVWT